ncbi:hypothetical protein FQN50_009806, partial [Emmonsiellopsis sp. PD_5]
MDEETFTLKLLKHFDLLIQHLQEVYKSTAECLHSLLSHRKITYDLLWALFRLNMLVYTTCHGTVEFAMADISDIEFLPLPFNLLIIDKEKKQVAITLVECHVDQTGGPALNNIIVGKGLGVIILLHGPPGVGKTLTAEAITERQEQPLYSISVGELSSEAAVFWDAILLLDEVDVFVQKHSSVQLERNRLVSIFLCKLEYYDGIFFLMTNLVGDFDDAILDRVHLKLQYDNLKPAARKSILLNFLKAADAEINEDDLNIFVETKLNGRQIKNMIKLAHSLATWDRKPLSAGHIRTALKANGYDIPRNSGLGFDD